MPVDWKTKESYQRLLAAMVAATQDMKLDYRKIASMYGSGATYDSIEGRFRIIKKEAAVLRGEVDSGARPEAPARGATTAATNTPITTPKKSRATNGATPGSGRKKNGSGVIGSKVEKTPTKKPRGGGGGGGGGSPNDPLTLDVEDMVTVKEEPDTTSSATSSMVQTPSFSDHEHQHLPTHSMDSNYCTPPAAGSSNNGHHTNNWHPTSSSSASGGMGDHLGLSIVDTSFSGMTPYDDVDETSFSHPASSFLGFGEGGSHHLGYSYTNAYDEEDGI